MKVNLVDDVRLAPESIIESYGHQYQQKGFSALMHCAVEGSGAPSAMLVLHPGVDVNQRSHVSASLSLIRHLINFLRVDR